MRIRHRILMVFLLTLFLLTQLSAEVKMMGLDLMPVPAKIAATSGKFRLSDSFQVTVKGDVGERLNKNVARWLNRMAQATGLFLSQGSGAPDSAGCIIQCNRQGKVVLHENESCRLAVSPERILLTAETDLGALRGLETLLQLVTADTSGYYVPAVTIEDQPRFPWRGLLIDVGRHFMPVDVIKRNLDGMAAVKMNVLHWHLTEDQGFRVECKTFPRLHEMGSDGLYYTQEQIKDILDYAAERGIRVVPEFDMPGHSASWFVGYPELASGPGPYQIIREWGIFDPAMNPAREETYQFLEKFFKEMAQLFPDEYVHIGGDENNGKQWDANREIQAFMKKNRIPDNHALQGYFNRRVQKILAKYNKKMVGWDEILQSDLPKDIVIHSWRGRKSLVESAKNGYPAILSNGYYIDLIQSAEFHYLNDPLPEDAPLTEQEKQLILGGEATMWSEFVSAENIDSRIWPRTAAIAERLWSPREVKDVDDMYRRLEIISFHLEELGLTHEKNYEMMLRRLANQSDITALKNLVDVTEPVKIYNRPTQRKYTTFSPLTRVVDAARPDADVARKFRTIVERYLENRGKSNGDGHAIKNYLTNWKSNHAELLPMIQAAPVLKEIETLSQDLSTTAGIGLEAFEHIENNSATDQSWVQARLDIINRAKQPRGQAELMVISAIEKLVQEAGSNKN